MTKPSLLPLVLAPFLLLAGVAGAAEPAPGSEPSTTKPTAKVNKEDLKTKLTPLQYKVACEGGTEPPFRNAYWDNHEPGIDHLRVITVCVIILA